MPGDLLERAVFRLTTDEAQFLIDRLVASQPTALLTMLAREGIDADCDYIWTHPHLSAFPCRRAPPRPAWGNLLPCDARRGAAL
jgi:hypothetical protein